MEPGDARTASDHSPQPGNRQSRRSGCTPRGGAILTPPEVSYDEMALAAVGWCGTWVGTDGTVTYEVRPIPPHLPPRPPPVPYVAGLPSAASLAQLNVFEVAGPPPPRRTCYPRNRFVLVTGFSGQDTLPGTLGVLSNDYAEAEANSSGWWGP